MLGCVRLFATLWTTAHQAPPSMGFSRQEYWSGLLFPPPGDLPDRGIKPASPVSPALAGEFFTTEPPGEPKYQNNKEQKQENTPNYLCKASENISNMPRKMELRNSFLAI